MIYPESASGSVLVDLLFAGIRGWKLRSGTPGRWFLSDRVEMLLGRRSHAEPASLCFGSMRSREAPDRCAYRLIERVYEAFGLRRENIPDLFDPETGRLVLPE